jgi:branched-chain amino acid transport system permease protein
VKRAHLQWLVAALVLGLLAALPFVLGTYWQQLGFRALQLLTLALAWNLLAGYGGQVSLGNGAFVGLGAYTLTLLANRYADAFATLPVALLLPAAGALAAACAALLSRAIFRLRGLYFTIGSLAFAEALRILMVNLPQFGGANGIVLKIASPPAYTLYWMALGVAALSALVIVRTLDSPASLALRAVRDDEAVAREMGVRTFRVKLLCFAFASFLMGLVGGLQALKLGVIEPYGAFGMSWTIDTVAIVVIGGLGTRGGALLGALLYLLLGELLRDQPELHGAITGLFLLAVIRLSPQGLWPALQRALRGRARPAEAVDG